MFTFTSPFSSTLHKINSETSKSSLWAILWHILQEEQDQYQIWQQLVQNNFPGGRFDNTHNTQDYLNGEFWHGAPTYRTYIDGKYVIFQYTFDNQLQKILAKVDFGWEDPNNIQFSKTDQPDTGQPAAQSVQKDSIKFMRRLKNDYLIPLKQAGIAVTITADDDQRMRIYHKATLKSGFKPMTGDQHPLMYHGKYEHQN